MSNRGTTNARFDITKRNFSNTNNLWGIPMAIRKKFIAGAVSVVCAGLMSVASAVAEPLKIGYSDWPGWVAWAGQDSSSRTPPQHWAGQDSSTRLYMYV